MAMKKGTRKGLIDTKVSTKKASGPPREKQLSESAANVKALLLHRRDPRQEILAEELSVSQSRVSAWKDGREMPSRETFLRLGLLAFDRPDLRDYFWKQAGPLFRLSEKVGEQSLKLRGEPLEAAEFIRVPCARRVGDAMVETGESMPVASRLVANPLSTVCVLIDEATKTRFLREGDAIVVDTSHTSSRDLRPFLDQTVLVDIDPDKPRRLDPGRHLIHWPQGLCIGRLKIKVFLPDPVSITIPRQRGLGGHEHVNLVIPTTWVATLSSLADVNAIWTPAEDSVYLGEWEPIEAPASPDERAWKGFIETGFAKAAEAIRLEEGCSIIGRVVMQSFGQHARQPEKGA